MKKKILEQELTLGHILPEMEEDYFDELVDKIKMEEDIKEDNWERTDMSNLLEPEIKRGSKMKCLNCNKKIGWINRGTHEEYIEYLDSKDVKNGVFCSFKCESNYKKGVKK